MESTNSIFDLIEFTRLFYERPGQNLNLKVQYWLIQSGPLSKG